MIATSGHRESTVNGKVSNAYEHFHLFCLKFPGIFCPPPPSYSATRMAAPEELRARALHRGRHRRVRHLYLKVLWKYGVKYVIANFLDKDGMRQERT